MSQGMCVSSRKKYQNDLLILVHAVLSASRPIVIFATCIHEIKMASQVDAVV